VQLKAGEFTVGGEIETEGDDAGKIMNITNFRSAIELERIGLEQLKEQLTLREMKCGGTL